MIFIYKVSPYVGFSHCCAKSTRISFTRAPPCTQAQGRPPGRVSCGTDTGCPSRTWFCAYIIHTSLNISLVFLRERAGTLFGRFLLVRCGELGFDSPRRTSRTWGFGATSSPSSWKGRGNWECSCAPAVAGMSLSRSGLWGADDCTDFFLWVAARFLHCPVSLDKGLARFSFK